jgi:hypothetical protein
MHEKSMDDIKKEEEVHFIGTAAYDYKRNRMEKTLAIGNYFAL